MRFLRDVVILLARMTAFIIAVCAMWMAIIPPMFWVFDHWIAYWR